MTPTGRRTPPAEAGFALIEVLVSALVLAIVAAAILALLQTSTRSAASERRHAEAQAIAQEDQARLRSLRLSALNRLAQEHPVTLDGDKFTVHSEGVFVNNKNSQPAACTGENVSADYVRITSTVTWTDTGTPHQVAVQSIVSPSNGSLDPTHGTLIVTTKNNAFEPLGGVTLTGEGPGKFSGVTDATGCGNFTDLPAGEYTVSATGTNLIDMNGYSPPKAAKIGVPKGETANLPLQFDNRPVTIPVQFTARVGSSGVFEAAKSDSVFVFNILMEPGRTPYWTPTKARESTVKATPVFPFTKGVTVYSGACETNNPNPEGKNPAGAAAMTSLTLSPGTTTLTQTLQIPAFSTQVWTGSGSSSKGSAVTSGHLVVTDPKCLIEGKVVKRTFTISGGNVQEPWLPYGTSYEICADNGSRRQTAKGVAITSLAATNTATIYLNSSGSSSGVCS